MLLGDRQQRLLKWRKGERISVKTGEPRLVEMNEDQLEVRNIRGEGLSIVLKHANELYTIPFQDKYLDLIKRKNSTFESAEGRGGITDLEGESLVSYSSTSPAIATKFLGADGKGACEWKIPAGTGGTVQDATITFTTGGGLSGGAAFTTNQSSNETIALTIADNAIGFAKIDDLARGSILYGNASAETVELTKGDNQTVLSSDGTDISWEDAGSITLGANSVDFTQLADLDAGEIFAGNSSNLTSILPKGTTGHVLTSTAGSLGWAAPSVTSVTVADESSDTTCFPLFVTDATGALAPKSGSNLTFNSSSGLLSATLLSGTLTGNVTGNLTGTASIATVASTVTVIDSTDTSSYIAMFDSATGSLAVKTDAGITYNAGTGMLTATGLTGPLTGNASTATNIAVTHGNVTDTSCFIPFVTAGSSANYGLKTEAGLAYDATNNKVTATTFVGALTGNASTATRSNNTDGFSVVADNSGNATNYPVFVSDNTGDQGASSDTGFTYNPNTGTLTSTTFAGTATTATNVTVADESSEANCNVLYTTTAAGNLPIKSGTNLKFNSSTGVLTSNGIKCTSAASSTDVQFETKQITMESDVTGNFPVLLLRQFNADGNSAQLRFEKGDSGFDSLANNDELGHIQFVGQLPGPVTFDYGNIHCSVTDITEDSEDSKMWFKTYDDGTNTTTLTLDGNKVYIPDGGTIGSATTNNAITIASDGDITIANDLTVSGTFSGTAVTRDYLPFGYNGSFVANTSGTIMKTVDGSTNGHGYVIPRSGTITAISASAINTLTSSVKATFTVLLNRANQASANVQLDAAVISNSEVLGSPVSFSAGDTIDTQVAIVGYAAGTLSNIALLVEVTT